MIRNHAMRGATGTDPAGARDFLRSRAETRR